MSIAEFVTDLLNPDLAFLAKAMVVALLSSIVCGVVGCHVVLRGMAFIGDAVAHAVFPGLAVAFVVQGSLVVGGMVAGLATAVLVAVFSHGRRLQEDAVIGVFYVAAFALGIVVISRAPGYAGSLQQFLFGSIVGIADGDVVTVAITAIAVLGAMFTAHKGFVAVSVDREMARSMGLRVFWLDLALYLCVTLAVVISVQIIGNILVLALIVTPAATSRLLTDRLGAMLVLSPCIGAASSIAGLYLSWSYDLPVGGTIVLVLTGAFVAAWLLAPRHGLIGRFVRPARTGCVLVAFLIGGLELAIVAADSEPASASGAPTVIALAADPDGGLLWRGTDRESNPSAVDLATTTGAATDVAWDLADLDEADFRSDLVRFRLAAFEGPGRFVAAAVTPVGSVEIFLDRTNQVDEFVLQLGHRGSMDWSFVEPGRYRFRLEASIPLREGGTASTAATFQVEVAEVARKADPTGGAEGSPGVAATSSAPPSVSGDGASPAARASEMTPGATSAPTYRSAPATTEQHALADGRVVIADGHVDVGPRFVDGRWVVQLRDDATSPPSWRNLGDAVLHVRDAARLAVPEGDAYTFLGPPRSTVYVLPQVQRAGLVWPGWNSQDPTVLDRVPGRLTWRLHGVDGPGRLVLYSAGSFGQTEVLFDSDEDLPQELGIERNTHAHGNWAFSEPGIYRLTIEMAATSRTGEHLRDQQVLTFAVGDSVDPERGFLPDGGALAGGGGPGGQARGGGRAMAATGAEGLAAQAVTGAALVGLGVLMLRARRRQLCDGRRTHPN